MVVIKISKIIDAMEQQMDTYCAYMDKKTEEIIFVSDEEFRVVEDEYLLEDYPEWQRETLIIAEKIYFGDEHYSLPSQYEIHEYKIMENFAYHCNNERLIGAIQGRGAYRRFKDQLFHLDLIDDYYDFYKQNLKKIAIDWCESNHIEYVED